MGKVNKIDSNLTGLRYAEEDSLGVVSGDEAWIPLEPNGYSDFGGSVTTVSRNPINPSRQKKKGVVTDLEASGGFGTDLTQENLQDFLQGFLFADHRKKDELSVASVDTGDTTDDYEPASGGDGYVADDLLFAKGFSDQQANGLKTVTGAPASNSVSVVEALPALAGQSGIISRVGFQFSSGDAVIDDAGSFPALTTTTKDLTALGLSVGEWVFIGGDSAGEQFDTAANNGFARVRAIATNRIDFDKTQGAMVADAGGSKTIRMFFGRVLKNETGSLIKRRSYQLERTLGAPDDSFPSQTQSEYVVGAVPNELSINIPSAEKITFDLSFIGTNSEIRTGAQGVKTGTRPTLAEADAFNTSSDFSRIKLAKVDDTDSSITPLFAFAEEITLTISNNISSNKALGVLGAFDVTVGTFEAGGSLVAYFADVAAVAAVRSNVDVTLDAHMVKENAGITIDIPLMSLGDGRPNIEQDQSIKLPLSVDAATGAKIDANLDHTLLMVFWDYLPDLADV
jgi:Phage tail tube protein